MSTVFKKEIDEEIKEAKKPWWLGGVWPQSRLPINTSNLRVNISQRGETRTKGLFKTHILHLCLFIMS